MPGEKVKSFVARPGVLMVCLAFLSGLCVAAAFFIGHAVYEKKSEDKDRQIMAARIDNKVLSEKNVELQDSLRKLEEKYKSLDSRYKELASSLVLAQHAAALNARSSPSRPPPIEQPVVREGEFAVELATTLNLTSSQDEAAAENYLGSVNIMPRNGWISDYPMTPEVIAEIRESVAKAASSGYLQISESDAVGLMDNVSMAMNLPVKAGYERSSEYQSRSAGPPPPASEYVEPSVVDDYYDDNKPPVVTYYPPPAEYIALYEWVPSPFWWEGFRFGGFFILVDFNRHYHRHRITNHVANADGTVGRVNATARTSTAAGQQTGPKGNGASTAYSVTSPNPAPPVSAPSTGSAAPNPGGVPKEVKRLTPLAPRVYPEAAPRSSSHDAHTFKGSQPSRVAPEAPYRGAVPGGGGGAGGSHGNGSVSGRH